MPAGWVTVDPPPKWRGPQLAFCEEEHRVRFFRQWIAAAMPQSLVLIEATPRVADDD